MSQRSSRLSPNDNNSGLDCVEMKSAIQERMERDTAAMSDAERRACFAKRADEFRRRSAASQHRTLAEILEMARQ